MAVHRREIYFVNLKPLQGREEAGPRPVLVLSVDAILRKTLACLRSRKVPCSPNSERLSFVNNTGI